VQPRVASERAPSRRTQARSLAQPAAEVPERSTRSGLQPLYYTTTRPEVVKARVSRRAVSLPKPRRVARGTRDGPKLRCVAHGTSGSQGYLPTVLRRASATANAAGTNASASGDGNHG
jgi:hypothetical protein